MAIIRGWFFWHLLDEWMLQEEREAFFALCSNIADHRAIGPVDSGLRRRGKLVGQPGREQYRNRGHHRKLDRSRGYEDSRAGTCGAIRWSSETCEEGSMYLNAYEKRILELHNQTREQRELQSLCVNPTLTEAACAHSKDMIEKTTSPTPLPAANPWVDASSASAAPRGLQLLEGRGNIAWHSNSEVEPESIFEGWMNSPGHRANILDEDFRQIEIGTYTGEYKSYEKAIMYTVDFGVRYQQ